MRRAALVLGRLLGTWIYRARQFFRGFRWAITPAEATLIRSLLEPAELELFTSMQARDRRHSMDLVHWLRLRAEPDRDLLAAALLHDVGKGHIWLWDRVVYVLLGALPGSLREQAARRGGARWREALWVLHEHGSLGAARLVAAGSNGEVVRLVAGHTGPRQPDDTHLEWLMAADRAC